MTSRPPPPRMSLRSPPLPEAPKESVVSRLLIAPLSFLTFLISLFLIDNWNHTHRTNLRNQPPVTIWGKTEQFLHGFIYKPISPYAYVKSPGKDGGDIEEKEKGKGKEEGWHWHTKQRKMMKAEVSDAFRLRGTVMVILMGLIIATTTGIVMMVRFAHGLWWNWGLFDVSEKASAGSGRWRNWYGPGPMDL